MGEGEITEFGGLVALRGGSEGEDSDTGVGWEGTEAEGRFEEDRVEVEVEEGLGFESLGGMRCDEEVIFLYGSGRMR